MTKEEIDLLHGRYLETLKEVQAPGLEGIDISRVLHNQCYYALTRGTKYKKLNGLAFFFLKRETINYSGEGSDLLMYSEAYPRRDHREYWTKLKSLFDEKDVLEFTNLGKPNLLKCVDLGHMPRKIKYYNAYKKALSGIPDKVNRKYLAVQLAWSHEFLLQVKKLNLKPKVAMCFFDSGIHESLLVQYFRSLGVKTVTNQHGQPLFRSKEHDRMNQSQILNFNSDYFIAKGGFTARQFYAAGFDEKRIKTLGGFGNPAAEYRKEAKHAFGLFPDTPNYAFAAKSNIELIKLANEISERTGSKYFIKVHPTDDINKYTEYLGKNAEVVEKNYDLKKVFKEIDFGLFYASAIYVDMLNNSVKSFQYSGEESFPIVENEEDKIASAEEFEIKYAAWDVKSEAAQADYLNNTRKQYCDAEGAEDRIKAFVNGLLNE